MKIDWIKVWDEYNEWFLERSKLVHCNKCNQSSSPDAPEWEEQQVYIQKLVDKRLKRIKR